MYHTFKLKLHLGCCEMCGLCSVDLYCALIVQSEMWEYKMKITHFVLSQLITEGKQTKSETGLPFRRNDS